MTKRLSLSEAARRFSILLEDVVRGRDRLAAESLTLRFVWQPATHPRLGQLWENDYFGPRWNDAGHYFAALDLPWDEEGTPQPCFVYLIRGNDEIYKVFTEICREAEAIVQKTVGDATRCNWAGRLFEIYGHECYGLTRSTNEAPDQPEAWNDVAELPDVFKFTSMLLKKLRDGATKGTGTTAENKGDSGRDAVPALRQEWSKHREARGKWLYEQCCKGTKYAAIIANLNKKPKTWDRLNWPNSVKGAANEYAKRHGKPPIPRRAKGRPKSK